MDDDKINMKNIKYQGEYEHIITIENIPNKKFKKKKIKKMLIEVMTSHELLAKTFFEVNLRKNNYVVF